MALSKQSLYSRVLVLLAIEKVSMDRFKCHKCNHSFASRRNLENHFNRKIPCDRGIRIYACMDCHKDFDSHCALKKHMGNKYGCGNNRPYFICKCGKQFVWQSDLNKHQRRRKTPCKPINIEPPVIPIYAGTELPEILPLEGDQLHINDPNYIREINSWIL